MKSFLNEITKKFEALEEIVDDTNIESEEEIEEQNVAGAVAGYNTPNAFGKDTDGDKKRKVKSTGDGFELAENRWLDLKRDETRTPSQKVSHGIREVKNQLAEIERFVNWYNRLRSENNLGKNDFFKRTNTNIYRIKERIIKIASSIQEIDKSESENNIEEVEGTKPMALDKFVVTATPKGASKDADRRTITKPAPKNSAQSQLKSLTKMDKYQSVRLKKA